MSTIAIHVNITVKGVSMEINENMIGMIIISFKLTRFNEGTSLLLHADFSVYSEICIMQKVKYQLILEI